MPVNIHAEEFPLRKIFSNDFAFSIPPYQRPYAWTTEQAAELLGDISAFAEENSAEVSEINPYFLGSVVLIKGDKPEADVVDGQQRLTTLTILLAVLRHLVASDAALANGVTQYLYEEGRPIEGTPNRYRLRLRERDADFFQEYIQDDQTMQKLWTLNAAKLTDSQRNVQANARYFLDQLQDRSTEDHTRLLQFMMTRCFLVVVSTPDLDSAYRIFSVMNARGLDLGLTDLLKSEIIGAIKNSEQDRYTQIWESEEEDLGRAAFQDLFAHIRMIYRKAKPRESALNEFRKYIRPQANPEAFINQIVKPYSDAFEVIRYSSYRSDRLAEKVNALARWLGQIDNSDWVPPAIVYMSRFQHEPQSLVRFFTDLERLAAGLMILRININKRIERYGRLLSAIEAEDDLYAEASPLQLTGEERWQIGNVLDGDLYLIGRIRQYVLLRLDSSLSQGEATYDYPIITIEHVLPQNPKVGSSWQKWFPTQELQASYVHRIGNLALLSRRKNAQAQNFDFDKKKDQYFATDKGVSPFVLTTQILKQHEWTPKVVRERQEKALEHLSELWRL